ncbi:MAG: FHA domain-containing protein, partial [Bythopirellula sp.]
MTTLTSDPSSSTSATSGLALIIAQSGGAARTLRLPLGKCTVGSSDRCQVHVTDAAVRPLHCLIVREPSGATVTRWAPGALLNEQEFSTAPFQPGDCLRIGEVQLTLVADEQESNNPPVQQQDAAVAPPASAPAQAEHASVPAAEHRVEQVEATAPGPEPTPSTPVVAFPIMPAATATGPGSGETAELVSRVQTANQSARKRCRNLIHSLRALREEANRFDQRVNDLEQQLRVALEEREAVFAQLSQLQSEAVLRESQSSAELDRLIEELSTAYEKAGVAETALAEQQQQLDQLQGELQRQLAEVNQERDQLVEQLHQFQAELGERETQTTQEVDRLSGELATAHEKVATVESELADRQQQLEHLQNELQQQLGELNEEKEQLTAQLAQ